MALQRMTGSKPRIMIRQNGSDTLNFIVQQFDVNNADLFFDAPRARYDLEQSRFNSIKAARADFAYDMDGFLDAIEGGVRYQELEYRDVPGASFDNRLEATSFSSEAVTAANLACRTPFPESGFMSSVTNGGAADYEC